MTDNQVEQCHEEEVDRWRFVGLNKVLPLRKIIAWCINVIATARFFLQIKQCSFNGKHEVILMVFNGKHQFI